MLFAGGLLGQLSMGTWSVRPTLGGTFDNLTGMLAGSWAYPRLQARYFRVDTGSCD